MKLRRTTRKHRNRKYQMDDRGEAGIGTMIVFISAVLVAAIAAGVLLDASSKMQDRSSRTSKEVADGVSSNLKLILIQGQRDNTTYDYVTNLNITLTLAPGAQDMDLSEMSIQFSTGTTLKTLNWKDAAAPTVGFFNVTKFRDTDGSFTSAQPRMNAGDLVSVNINMTVNGLELPSRKNIGTLLVPAVGTPVRADFRTPASYGLDTVIELR